jgi:hypothetical protein
MADWQHTTQRLAETEPAAAIAVLGADLSRASVTA